VKYALEYIQTHSNELPAIRESYQLGLTLEAANLGTTLGPFVEHGSAEFANRLVAHYEGVLLDIQTLATLYALKTLRDKAVAHNEQIEPVAGPTWTGLQNLVAHAKSLVGILGWAWIGTAYDMSGKFTLTDDATRPKRAFDRLLEKLVSAQ
jgi:hypothetical protein